MMASQHQAFGGQGRGNATETMLFAMLAGLALSTGLVAPARAQDGAPTAPANPVVSRAVVQPLPDPAQPSLNAARARLRRNPRDVAALVAAGKAALTLGDTEAATGFFTRALVITPADPAITALLASVRVIADDAPGALALFAAAEHTAPLAPARLVDRGLAYDLVGDNARAQADYRRGLQEGEGDETSRRLALSLAISGDARGAEAVLAPLLQKQDRAAWRTRAFALAILGREEEAVAIARATMPSDLALGIAPYLRAMRRLTRAQQAAAANLGHFPSPARFGIDDPATIAYTGNAGANASAGAVHITEAAPASEPPPSAPLPEQANPAPTPAPSAPTPLLPAPAETAATPSPPAPSTKHQPARAIDFAKAFASFGDAKPDAAPAKGAVDIRTLNPPKLARPKPPPPPPAPSRIWVELGVGRKIAALRHDWRRMTEDAPRLFRNKTPSITGWGRTNRLLVGPFASEEAAKAWLEKAKPDHPSAFVWISPTGQAVDRLETP